MEDTALLSDNSSRYTYSGELADVDESGAGSKLDISRSGRGRTLCLLLAAISSLIVLLLGFHFISHYFKMRPRSDPYAGGLSGEAMLCRTTCSDPCSSYESIVGKLCCDWERGIGDPTCPLLVTDDGVCTCPQDPKAAAVPSDADELTPTLAPVPSTLRLSSWWFHPTTTIHHDDHHPTNWWNTHPTNNHHDDHFHHHDDHFHHHDDHYHHYHDDFWGIH